MATNTKFKAGEIIQFTSGMYSDKVSQGIFVAIQDFDLFEEVKSIPKDSDEDIDWLNIDRFIAILITREILMPVKYRDFHLSDSYNYLHDYDISGWNETANKLERIIKNP